VLVARDYLQDKHSFLEFLQVWQQKEDKSHGKMQSAKGQSAQKVKGTLVVQEAFCVASTILNGCHIEQSTNTLLNMPMHQQ
jgi:hypothetical protein